MKEILAHRMQQLGYSQYKLTQEVCKLRSEDGDVPPVLKYNSSIGKALNDPDNVKLYIIEDIVNALGGEIIIRWNNPQEIRVD
ncbi:hypothetical protein [Leptolyngbya sp. FACHB-16]|nr:hypothetical protein [Leptolyngbya sp. FACHB-16]MBD1912117.1 hypothetical protein [Leptolyngbya sp. FACHB-8]MBD2155008.1 hypothetical protein [Leptolyngbya sp. FACHB-16]